MKIKHWLIGLVAIGGWHLGPAVAQTPTTPNAAHYTVDIPAENLGDALQAFALASHQKLLYSSDLVVGKTSPALKGEFTTEDGVRRLLVNSGLKYEVTNNGLVMIRSASAADATGTPVVKSFSDPANDPKNSQGAGKQSSQDFRLAQANQANTGPQVASDAASDKKKDELTEIVVTGTHIKGTDGIAANVHVYTREDINESGRTTLASFIQNLSQNFSGGGSESTIQGVTGTGTVNNVISGTGVNLRGLGNSATLVLINGHRVASSNIDGDFVDISMIPLSAVERIEVVTDGASAIYGSDAIGGVINFILRKDFDGSETRGSYGTVTQGTERQLNASQTVGHRWGSGSAVVTYDYFDQTPLSAADRPYTQSAPLPFSLLPEQVRNSVYAHAEQDISTSVQSYGDAFYSHRETSINQTSIEGGFQIYEPSLNETAGGLVGASITLPRNLTLDVNGGYSWSRSEFSQYDAGVSAPQAHAKATYGIASAEAILNGALWSTSQGDTKFAIGAQYRRESYGRTDYLSPEMDFNPTREVIAGFAELHIPLLGPNPGSTHGARVELTLANREEHYNDFGSANNPEVGITWRPAEALRLRGTYGTSFEAPNLSALNPAIVEAVPLPLADPGTGTHSCQPLAQGNNCTYTIFDAGDGNPNLRPQKATSWTLGLDFAPSSVPGLRASASYYNLVFKDQVEPVLDGINDTADVLGMANTLGPGIVQRNPPIGLINQYAASSGFINVFNIPLNEIGAIFRGGENNLSRTRTSGIDFDVSYTQTAWGSNFSTGIDGTYVFKFENQFFGSGPEVKLLDTPYNPIDLRFRAHVGVTHDQFAVTAFLNYVNSYTDNRQTPSIPISSWTTVDLAASYKLPTLWHAIHDSSIQLSVQNVANRAPPFVSNSSTEFSAINFDGANANALGRFVSLQFVLSVQ